MLIEGKLVEGERICVDRQLQRSGYLPIRDELVPCRIEQQRWELR